MCVDILVYRKLFLSSWSHGNSNRIDLFASACKIHLFSISMTAIPTTEIHILSQVTGQNSISIPFLFQISCVLQFMFVSWNILSDYASNALNASILHFCPRQQSEKQKWVMKACVLK